MYIKTNGPDFVFQKVFPTLSHLEKMVSLINVDKCLLFNKDVEVQTAPQSIEHAAHKPASSGIHSSMLNTDRFLLQWTAPRVFFKRVYGLCFNKTIIVLQNNALKQKVRYRILINE